MSDTDKQKAKAERDEIKQKKIGAVLRWLDVDAIKDNGHVWYKGTLIVASTDDEGEMVITILERSDIVKWYDAAHKTWLTCTNPMAMLAEVPNASDRKFRLYVLAVAEKQNNPSAKFFREDRPPFEDEPGLETSSWLGIARSWSILSRCDTRYGRKCSHDDMCGLIREIFGYPHWQARSRPCGFCIDCTSPKPSMCQAMPQLKWLSADVVGLAQTIDATDEWDKMPILADALMDAGCDDDEVIRHCMGKMLVECPQCEVGWSGKRSIHVERSKCGLCDGTGLFAKNGVNHIRGCWVIDLILGRV